MSSGAYALYVDVQAGSGGGGGMGGAGAAINRIVPLPRSDDDDDDDFEFDHRRLTLYYDNSFVPTAAGAVTIAVRFLGVAAAPTNVTVTGGECEVVDVPRRACAASLHIDQLTVGVRGPVSALVEYSD